MDRPGGSESQPYHARVGALSTLDELCQAIDRYSVESLPLRVEPEAEAAVRESLKSSRLLLVGECHGVAENPLIASALLEHFNLRGLALEWEAAMRPGLDAFFSDGELDELARHPLFWCGDERITAGHLAMLRARRAREARARPLLRPKPPWMERPRRGYG